MTPPTFADPQAGGRGADGAYPTEQQVRAARSRVGDATVRVAEIQSELVVADQRFEAAGIAAEQAAEAYNGAVWRVQQAADALRRARADAIRADGQVRAQRDELAGLVASSYQGAGDLAAVNALVGAEGPEGVMSQMLAFEGASTSLQGQFQKFTATATLADVFRAEAEDAKAEQVRLLAEAEDARDAASAAAAAAQQAAADLAAQKSDLVTELARLQGISVALATQRQTALEEIQRRRAARAAAASQAASEAAAQAAADATRGAVAQPDGRQPHRPEQGPNGGDAPGPAQQERPPRPQPHEPSTPSPPAPPAPSPPSARGGAARAIAFAKAQLGEPYVWAAAGPDSWDCSGLTMAAWQAGGVSLPHYSVAQYDATTPITAGQLRPGDLVFWGTTSSPSSIHHVALYIGDGLILHAPRTGRTVSIDAMSYWPPNFFGRV